MLKEQFIAVCGLAALFTSVGAQTTVNPDISFISDFRASVHGDSVARSDEYGKLTLDLHELEIAAAGYLNPYARADVFLAIHGPEATVEIEEAYMTILHGLPLGLQLKAGQYLVDFGKINTQHPHQWSWIERPLMHREMFGDDGLRDVGLNFNGLYPIGKSVLGVSFNLLRSGGSGHHHHSGEEENEVEARNDVGVSLRAMLFHPFNDFTSIEIGGSLLRFENDPFENRYAIMSAVDIKARWTPNSYRSLTLVAELLTNQRTVDDTTTASDTRDVSTLGMFSAFDLQFLKRFHVGVFYEMTQGVDNKEEEQIGMGLFAGFALAEETTRLQLVLRRDEIHGDNPFYTALAQILWSLGPHKPHIY